ncbi:hypothetical protein ACIBHY_29735 [Nonomuraea sp. NPDC050547]|uniref:hypothetical protein n=1 Tax=Nonomuraea sp. NPDC050547 TaxID=3364368 RepID=UPI0037AF2052
MSNPDVELVVQQTAGPDLSVQHDGGISLTIEQHDHVVELDLAIPGIQGPPGVRGEQGPAGPEGGAFQREYQFAIPSLVWEAEHGQSRQPNHTCFAPGGERIEGDPSYPDARTIRITWAVPMSGALRLT